MHGNLAGEKWEKRVVVTGGQGDSGIVRCALGTGSAAFDETISKLVMTIVKIIRLICDDKQYI